MVNKRRDRAQSVSDDSNNLTMNIRRTAVSLAVAAALPGVMAMPMNAYAQDDDDEVIEEIVTYGTYRASLIDSINTKRNSTSIVEAISAEDIGKLPDSSIAEALSRLPGLAGQRLDGRQSSISVRGLGEDFSTTTLNGREQVSIGDNRGIEFDLYPSEIISGVTVYKTPDASLMTQGIAGTINLSTVRPLDYDRSITVNAHLEQNEHDKLNPDGDDSGYRGAIAYIDQFADDTVGVALAYVTMNSPNQEERWNSWGFPDNAGDLELGGAKPFVRSSTLDRDTVMGILTFEPTDTLSITADYLYIDFSDEKHLRGIEIPGGWAGDTTVGAVEDGLITSGSFDNRRPQIRNDYEQREADLHSYGINAAWGINDDWTLTFDASRGEVEREIWSLESYSTATGRSSDDTTTLDNIGYVLDGGAEGARFTPELDYSDPALVTLGGAQGWGNGNTVPNDAQDGFINTPDIDDKLTTFQLSADVVLDFGPLTGLEFGAYYSDREKSKFDDGLFLTLPSYPNVEPIPSQYMAGMVSLDFFGMGDIMAYDSFAFWGDGGYDETSERDTVAGRWQNTWTVEEEVTTLYAMAEFDTDWGNVGVSGNFGLQYVDTDQSSDGYATQFDSNGLVVPTPVSGGDDFTDVLPSLNVIFNLTDEQMIRFGAAKTMSRSRMDRMNASYGVDYNANPTDGIYWNANGANPGLKPQKATQFDLSYEYYFSDDGYIGVAYFYKDLDDWQVQRSELFEVEEITPPGGGDPLGTTGQITYWVNASGGDVSGFELSGSYQFGELTSALEGFGVVASATFLDSSINIDDNEIDVPGLSDEVYNITLFYERAGFEARVSGSIRDDFLGEVSAISFSRELVEVKDTSIWDAQISYQFENSSVEWLQPLTVLLQGQNLTDEPFVTYQNEDERQVRDYQDYGRNYLLGVSYTFE